MLYIRYIILISIVFLIFIQSIIMIKNIEAKYETESFEDLLKYRNELYNIHYQKELLQIDKLRKKTENMNIENLMISCNLRERNLNICEFIDIIYIENYNQQILKKPNNDIIIPSYMSYLSNGIKFDNELVMNYKIKVKEIEKYYSILEDKENEIYNKFGDINVLLDKLCKM